MWCPHHSAAAICLVKGAQVGVRGGIQLAFQARHHHPRCGVELCPGAGLHEVCVDVASVQPLYGGGKEGVALNEHVVYLCAHVIGVVNLAACHVQFYNAKHGGEIGVAPRHDDVCYRLVFGHGLVVIVGHVDHRPIGVQNVDIAVAV